MVVAVAGAAIGATLTPAGSEAADMAPDIARNLQWAEQVFAAGTGTAPTQAAGLVILHEDVAGDTKAGRCAAGGPLRLGDRVYGRGIGVNSQSTLRVSVGRPAARFRAVIGLDRNVDNTPASVRFHVRAAGAAVFSTEVIRAGAAPQEIDVPLAGATEVDLVVDDGGDGRGWDQGDWADARLVFDDGSQVWLDDLAREVAFPAELPFSFVYGGKPSAELLPAWQRTVATDRGQPGMVRHTVALTDPATGLRVTAICQAYTDTPGVDWTLAFTNTGDADTPIIEQARALDTWVAAGIGTEVVLHRLNGSPCRVDDWLPFDQPVAPGQTVEMTTTQGRSSNVSPFFTLDWGSGGVVTGLGWSGQWTAAASLQEGRLRLQAGQQRLRTVLHPGESIRSPRVLQTYWAGGDQFRGCNLFRRTMLAHIVPKVDGRPAYPPSCT
jgi:hypothetical protein